MNETPSNLGVKRCLAWIKACEEMGWPKSAIPKLVDIFWEFKDRDGNLKGEGPTQETEPAPVTKRVSLASVLGIDLPVTQQFDCHKCANHQTLSYMIVCPTCGNKRCPKASDHELACTNSNAPGQPGSVY